MFNTNLPSGRRRLFLLVLFVFVVAGFSAKYLLIHLGWVGNAGQQDKKPQSQPEQTANPEEVLPTLSPEQLQKAQQTADDFMRAYANRNTDEVDRWLQSVKPYASDSLLALLEEETNFLKEKGVKFISVLKEIHNLHCQEQSGEVRCLAETVAEESENGKTIPIERVYQVTLTEQNGNWIAQEVEVRGSFD